MEQLERLLAAKREERPAEGYWQDFLCEFHQRQREQVLRKSPFAGVFGRLSEWTGGLGHAKWVYGAGLAYAAMAAFFLLAPRAVEAEVAPSVPVNHTVVPAAAPAPAIQIEQLKKLDLSPSVKGNVDEQVF